MEAAAFAITVGKTEPVLGLPMAGLAAALLRHRLIAGEVGDVLAGTAIRIDVALAGERLFLNTSSLGSYPAFVAIRERWKGRVGKPVAAAIALLVAVRRQKPLRLVVDGHAHDVTMMFVGYCRTPSQ
ncbi:MAG: hypothetical protein ACRDQU_02500 [Pseudonocardiaceae bacterium]